MSFTYPCSFLHVSGDRVKGYVHKWILTCVCMCVHCLWLCECECAHVGGKWRYKYWKAKLDEMEKRKTYSDLRNIMVSMHKITTLCSFNFLLKTSICHPAYRSFFTGTSEVNGQLRFLSSLPILYVWHLHYQIFKIWVPFLLLSITPSTAELWLGLSVAIRIQIIIPYLLH